MNTATVIYSNMGDIDTQVLTHIWEGLPNTNVIEVSNSSGPSSKKVDAGLRAEKDTLILCGHGFPSGLLSPLPYGEPLLVSSRNVHYIHAKRVIGIWCYASSFAKNEQLAGFFSSMFISNPNEAKLNGCYASSAETITREEILFAKRLNALISNDIPMQEWKQNLLEQANKSIDIVRFNYNGLSYFREAG